MHLRDRVLSVAEDLDLPVREELRWGEPAYLAPKGSTLRIAAPKSGGFAIYAHCATSLISDFASVAPCRTEKNRAVLFDTIDEAKAAPLDLLITAALTYHATR